MKTMLINIFIFCAQLLVAQTTGNSNPVIESVPKVGTTGSSHAAWEYSQRKFGDYFMKKAVLVDPAGEIVNGRANIVSWYEHQTDAPGNSERLLNSMMRQIRPDLILVTAQSQVGFDSKSTDLTYNILWRRVDGNWYIESCSIVSASAWMDSWAAFFHPGMLDPMRY